jgi:hypothetical protein
MTETGAQLLGHAVPVCQWLPQISPNPSSTIPAYPPRFPDNVREWIGFFRAVRMQAPPPGGFFPVFPTDTQPLDVEASTKTRFQINVSFPIRVLLQTQGADIYDTCPGLLGIPDLVLCTGNPRVPKMPFELKTRHNLNLCGYNLWQVYRYADRRQIRDPNFKFKKRILSQVFGEMACNGLHYGILSNYSDTYFLRRDETSPARLYVSRVVQPADINPTLRECVYYISQLAINDNAGSRLGRVVFDNISSNDDDDDDDSSYHDPDDPNDPDYHPDDSESSGDDDYDDDVSSGKRKRTSKSSSKTIASSSRGITTVGEYIGGGSFANVFSGYYDNQAVAWKTGDVYKKQEEMKMLKHEAHIYHVLRECQGTIFFHPLCF